MRPVVTNKFDAATLYCIGAEIEQALAIIADKHGISIRPLGGPYDDTSATIHLQLLVRDSAGEPITPERAAFARFAQEYGLRPTDLDREFVYNGYRWTVVGLNTGRPKYPILARKKIDGRLYKLTADAVRFALSREDTGTDRPGYDAFRPQLRMLQNEQEDE